VIATPFRTAGTAGVIAVVLSFVGACSEAPPPTQETPQVNSNDIVQLLSDGQAVFGVFSGDKTADQGAKITENRDTDFVFYSLETGPFDIPTMEIYMQAMVDAAGEGAHPVVLRIPPMRDDVDLAGEHMASGLEAGVDGLVFPHVETADEAALAVSSMGDELWPANPDGRLINILLIEDKIGVENAREIVGTSGVSVVIPGPGDLRRAYEGDAVAIEEAIQTVLRACQEFDVPCGITAGADDIAERLAQGFRLIIANGDDALPVGKMAAGRND
jgi:2-keto-3-deoxy-L-rhamnonate aldolase RhmA